MNEDTFIYNNSLEPTEAAIAHILSFEINNTLPSQAVNKVWHGHPVWFLEGNPVVGYDKLKDSIRLLFWSGQSFDEPKLQGEGLSKSAEIRYTTVNQIDNEDLTRWLKKSISIQWDYKNVAKRKGVLERLV